MTENFYLIGFVACFIFGCSMAWRYMGLKRAARLAGNTSRSTIVGLLENIERLVEENKALKLLTESPASESAKKVDWEPDDYKDLSDGLPEDVKTKFNKYNYKRFDQDELDELEDLTSHQKFHVGG